MSDYFLLGNRMSAPSIAFRFEAQVTLEAMWYDQHWYDEMIEDGWTHEGALREMLRMGWQEDWTSIVQAMTDVHPSEGRADVFADRLVTEVALVDSETGEPVEATRQSSRSES